MSRFQNLFRADEIDPESRNRFLLIAAIVGIVTFAIALIAVGYYVDRIKPRGETVFIVGERNFSYAYLEDRVEAGYAEGRINLNNFQFSVAQLVSDIQNEELIRLIAAEEGIAITSEELDIGIRASVRVTPETDQNIYAAALRNRLQFLGLSLDRYEEIIEAELLEQKLREVIAAGLPEEAEQVDLHVILVETDAAAVAARERIAGGEDFAAVAMQVSQHSSGPMGGYLGWRPRDLLVEELAEAAFTMEAGTISDIIERQGGFYILKLDGKEVREMDEETRSTLVLAYVGDRLEAAAAQYALENRLTFDQTVRLYNRVAGSGG